MTDLVKPCTSSSVMRPLGPLPCTSSSGTPSSRANLRTEGEACGRPSAGVPVGAGAAATLTAAAGTATAAAAAGAAAGAAAAKGAGAAAPAAPSRIASKSPMLTVSPTLTLSSFSTPACEEGISIDALSDSTVIRLCSTLMVSPGLTNTSMTATSLKSPISGTRTCTGPDAAGAASGAAAAAGAAAGAATGAGAAAAGAAAGAGAAASPAASTTSTTEPSFTLSPRATRSSFTTPAPPGGVSL